MRVLCRKEKEREEEEEGDSNEAIDSCNDMIQLSDGKGLATN